jgi:hypothetical protein
MENTPPTETQEGDEPVIIPKSLLYTYYALMTVSSIVIVIIFGWGNTPQLGWPSMNQLRSVQVITVGLWVCYFGGLAHKDRWSELKILAGRMSTCLIALMLAITTVFTVPYGR